jgi:CBS domain-containing protein
MDRLGAGSLLVEREGKLVGIVTERDFVVRVLATFPPTLV